MRTFAFLSVFAVCLLATAGHAQVPVRQQLQFPDLDGPVTVYWDEWDIPHIYATTTHDAYFAQGYAVASKRYFSMDFTRRYSGGRLAEVLGEELFGSDILRQDRESREQGFALVARQNWQALPENLRDELRAYADGVNAYVWYLKNVAPDERATEYFFLNISADQLAEWDPADSLLILAVQAIGSVLDMGDDLGFIRREQRWTDGFDQPGNPRFGLYDMLFTLEPPVKLASTSGWPSGGPLPAPPFTGPDLQLRKRPLRDKLRPEVIDRVLGIMERNPFYKFGDRLDGNSNAWAVRGNMTVSGAPLYCADPHLALQNPTLMFQNHVNTRSAGGGLDMAGVSIPGIPGVAIGFSNSMAWGLTNGQLDCTDTYVEDVVKNASGEPGWVRFNGGLVEIERIEEVIKVKDGNSTRDEIATLLRVPHHGLALSGSWDPDTNTLITYKNDGYNPTQEYRAFSEIARGKSVHDFFNAMEHVVDGQAFICADTNNNILFHSRYKVPIRDPRGLTPENPPWKPYDGTGEFEWQGFYPKEATPWELNPDKNYVATSNQDPVGVTFDGDCLPTEPNEIYIGDIWDIGFRQDRIEELLSNRSGERSGKIDVDFMKRVQGDHKSAMGRRLTPFILDAIQANPKGLAGSPEIVAAAPFLQGWETHGYDTPTGMDANATVADREASAATSIFNVFLTRFYGRAMGDEAASVGEGVFSANGSTYGLRGFLKIMNEADGNFIMWDDMNTPGRETRDEIILLSLQDSLAWLSTQFSTANPLDWKWGELHTITFESLIGLEGFNNPSGPVPGYARPGDGYCIDACGDWTRGNNFTFDDGPAVRIIAELKKGDIKGYSALPGGQDGQFGSEHYIDDAVNYWTKNRYHPLAFEMADVLQYAVSLDQYGPDPFPTPTASPSPTPSPSPTATPRPSTEPEVLMGGFLSSNLISGGPGTLVLWAYCTIGTDQVELGLYGVPTGFFLTNNGDASFSSTLTFELLPDAVPNIEIDLTPFNQGQAGWAWPFLHVKP